MKHTLKSLLITTILTLPTVFGAANHFPESTDQPTTKPQLQSIADLSDRAFALRNRPAAVKRLYLESLDHPDIQWSHVTFIAAALEKLGYLDSAILAYEYSMEHPNTQRFNQIAQTKIETIKTSTSSRAPSYLKGLSDDCLGVIVGGKAPEHSIDCFGVIDGDKAPKFFLGFLPLRDLYALTLVSTALHHIAQPLLNTANTWRKSNAVTRLLLNAARPEDNVMLQLFGTATESFFRMILCVATDLRRNIRIYGSLVYSLERLLMGTETPLDIRNTAKYFNDQKDHEKAAKFYERSAQHPNANPTDINMAAKYFNNHEDHEKAAKFYERFAQHPNANPTDILTAANYFNGHKDHEKAAKFYERFAQHPNANPTDIRCASSRMSYLGANYHERAAALYEKLATREKATFDDILWAANGLKELGSVYYPQAAELYIKSTNHKVDTRCFYFHLAAKGLKELGSDYYPRAADLYEQLAAHPYTTPDDIQMIAHFLKVLGPNYCARANAVHQK